jgi:dihydrofolate reductase
MTKPVISLIVAVANNGVIGNKGALPWRIPEDMRWFRMHTLGKPIIMGRKTWDSLPKKPLPGRPNIVMTATQGWSDEGAITAHDWDQAIAAAGDAAEIVVIGGAAIYAMALPVADRIYLTNVGLSPEGDAFMPPLARDEWRESFAQTHPALGDALPGFTFRILERAPPSTPS